MAVVPKSVFDVFEGIDGDSDLFFNLEKLSGIVSPKDVKFYYAFNKAFFDAVPAFRDIDKAIDRPNNVDWITANITEKDLLEQKASLEPYVMNDDTLLCYISVYPVGTDGIMLVVDSPKNPGATMISDSPSELYSSVMGAIVPFVGIEQSQSYEVYRRYVVSL